MKSAYESGRLRSPPPKMKARCAVAEEAEFASTRPGTRYSTSAVTTAMCAPTGRDLRLRHGERVDYAWCAATSNAPQVSCERRARRTRGIAMEISCAGGDDGVDSFGGAAGSLAGGVRQRDFGFRRFSVGERFADAMLLRSLPMAYSAVAGGVDGAREPVMNPDAARKTELC